MTTAQLGSDRRRSGFAWSIRAAWLLALLGAALQFGGVLTAASAVPEQLTANPLTATIDTAQPLQSVGQNSYSGTAFIPDGAAVRATRITAQVRDPATSVRIGLAFGPLAWALTGTGVAIALSAAFGRLAGRRPDARFASRAFACTALVLAVGSSAGQVLDEVARTGLQGVMWHGPQGMAPLGGGAASTFQLGWLAVAVGVLAVAAVVARLPQPEPERAAS